MSCCFLEALVWLGVGEFFFLGVDGVDPVSAAKSLGQLEE